eukprot:3351508-Amphidinium_carterae.1
MGKGKSHYPDHDPGSDDHFHHHDHLYVTRPLGCDRAHDLARGLTSSKAAKLSSSPPAWEPSSCGAPALHTSSAFPASSWCSMTLAPQSQATHVSRRPILQVTKALVASQALTRAPPVHVLSPRDTTSPRAVCTPHRTSRSASQTSRTPH